ncbi:WD repeat-containing protein 74 [Mactra antiquata]
MAAPMYNVFLGAETGLLKGINTLKGSWNNLNAIETPSKTNEITCMSWTGKEQFNFHVGLRSQNIANYDLSSQVLSDFKSFDCGPGNLKAVGQCDDLLITAVESGLVKLWRDDACTCDINTGNNIHCMTVGDNVIGTGGKKSDAKIWDIDNPGKPIFQVKNVKNDWLNLEVPVWVTAIQFLSDNKIVTATGHHQVRVYDPSVQRRPVLDMTFDEYPITAMSLYNDNQVIVGNTQGSMALLDIRKGQCVHRFKGFAGSIRSIQCHQSLPIVASCGLDRFFRLHDINSKQLLHKVYLKSRLNCLLMSKKEMILKDDGDDDSGAEVDADHHEDDDEEDGSDDDDVWNKMQVVKTRTVKRKSETLDNPESVPENPGKKKKSRSKSKKTKTN